MKKLMVAVTVLSLVVPSVVLFHSEASSACTFAQQVDLELRGLNHVQIAKICNGGGPPGPGDDRTTGEKILDGLLGSPASRATVCQTQYGTCPLNEGITGNRCSCMAPNGNRDYGTAR